MSDEPAHATKLLFVCSRNRLRSLTAERIFGGIPGIQVRSAGTQPDARIVVTEGHVGWADVIFVMEKSHLNRLRMKFPAALEGKRVITLGIPTIMSSCSRNSLTNWRERLRSTWNCPVALRIERQSSLLRDPRNGRIVQAIHGPLSLRLRPVGEVEVNGGLIPIQDGELQASTLPVSRNFCDGA